MPTVSVEDPRLAVENRGIAERGASVEHLSLVI